MIKRIKIITFRVTNTEAKKLKLLAQKFTESDVSEYIRWCLFNAKILANKRDLPKKAPYDIS